MGGKAEAAAWVPVATAGKVLITPGDAKQVVRFENVGMRYGEGPEVLRDLSFELAEGSFHFLTGDSGAGKSSLLRLLYLARQPTRGAMTLFGRDVALLSRRERAEQRRKIGVVFQDFRLLDHLTAFDNVALPLRIAGEREDIVRSHVEELLAWVGLGDSLDARPPTLSGGEQQRVAIARAVISNPSILLADEPTGNVDDRIAMRLMHLFQEMHRQGTCVMIATHNHALVAAFQHPQLHLENGMLSVLPPRQKAYG